MENNKWEEELKRIQIEWEHHDYAYTCMYCDAGKHTTIKDFIRSLLSQQSTQLAEKIKGMKDNYYFGFSIIVSENPNPSEDYKKGFLNGYNNALQNVLNLIKNK